MKSNWKTDNNKYNTLKRKEKKIVNEANENLKDKLANELKDMYNKI